MAANNIKYLILGNWLSFLVNLSYYWHLFMAKYTQTGNFLLLEEGFFFGPIKPYNVRKLATEFLYICGLLSSYRKSVLVWEAFT